MWLHSSVGRASHRYSWRSWTLKSRWSPDFFFQASCFQLLKLENLLRSLFTFIYNCTTIWIISYILHITSLHRKIWTYYNKLTSLLMCGFIAQLVKHCTGIRRGHGFESHWSPDFLFRLHAFNCLNWKIYGDDHSSLLLPDNWERPYCNRKHENVYFGISSKTDSLFLLGNWTFKTITTD